MQDFFEIEGIENKILDLKKFNFSFISINSEVSFSSNKYLSYDNQNNIFSPLEPQMSEANLFSDD